MKAFWLEDADQADISGEYLAGLGVHYERLSLDPAEHQGPLDALKATRGYIQQDEVALRPDTPNLDTICAKFIEEHTHADDEVRFVLEGDGIFDIRDDEDRWMRVYVEAGDLIVVPKDRHHRFLLSPKNNIRCVRLFKDAAGWVPNYRQSA